MQADEFTTRTTKREIDSEQECAAPAHGNYVARSYVPRSYVARNQVDRISYATLAERVIGFMERYNGFIYE